MKLLYLQMNGLAVAERPRYAMSVDSLSTAADLYEKSHFKRLAVGDLYC